MSASMEETAQLGGTPTLRSRMIYFAHPIDMADLGSRELDRMLRLREALSRAGATIYDPAGAFDVGLGSRPTPALARVNRQAILAADAVVACFPERKGIGTAMEIQLADDLGMPLVVLSDVGDRSWSLAGLEHALLIKELHSEVLPWLAEEAAEYVAVRGREPAADPLPMWVQAPNPSHIPVRKHADDAGFDLFVSEETKIPAGGIVDVPAGCAVQLPENVWGLIVGRSSTSRVHRLLAHPGVIDTGYRGPLFVQVENLGEGEFLAQEGMRLGQLIPLPNFAAQMAAVPTVMLQPTDRGSAGFGSTGA